MGANNNVANNTNISVITSSIEFKQHNRTSIKITSRKQKQHLRCAAGITIDINGECDFDGGNATRSGRDNEGEFAQELIVGREMTFSLRRTVRRVD